MSLIFKSFCSLLVLGQVSYAIPDGAPPLTTLPSATSALQSTSVLLVTATTGTHPVVTFTPSQDPQYSTITGTTTTTDKEHHTIVIFPLGWIWAPVGAGVPPELPKTLPPPQTTQPNSTPTNCQTTAPPECTKTISYVSLPSGYTKTTLGECPKPTGCVGPQVTQTTTIHTQLPYLSGPRPEIPIALPAGDPEPDLLDYFKGLFLQLRLSTDQAHPSPVCPTDKVSDADYLFFTALSQKFCDKVKNEKTNPVTMDLDGTALDKRHLQARTPPPGSQEYQGFKFHFEWVPKKGNCFQDCTSAFSTIAQKCGRFGRLSNGMKMTGTLDAGCGDYKWEIKEPPKQEPLGTPGTDGKPVCYRADDGLHDQTRPGGISYGGFLYAINYYCGLSDLKMGSSLKPEDSKFLVANAWQSDPNFHKDYLWLRMYVAGDSAPIGWPKKQPECKNPRRDFFSLRYDYAEGCRKAMLEIFSSCKHDCDIPKDGCSYGGIKIENSDEFGCIVWSIDARNGLPPEGTYLGTAP